MPDRLYKGRVLAGGLLILDQPRDYAKHVRSLAGQYVELTLRKQRTQRSHVQNRWLWGCALELLVEDFGYDIHERKAAKEHLHYKLVRICFGTHHDAKLGEDVPNVRSSKLSTAEFSRYMEWLVRYAAQEYHVVIPLPNEIDLTTLSEGHGMTGDDEGDRP